jgi:hypothetical protein
MYELDLHGSEHEHMHAVSIWQSIRDRDSYLFECTLWALVAIGLYTVLKWGLQTVSFCKQLLLACCGHMSCRRASRSGSTENTRLRTAVRKVLLLRRLRAQWHHLGKLLQGFTGVKPVPGVYHTTPRSPTKAQRPQALSEGSAARRRRDGPVPNRTGLVEG